MASPDRSDTPVTTKETAGWPVQATDTIVRVVDSVRDKTTGPALNVARWLVYGLVLALLALPLAIVALVGVFRLAEGGLLWASGQWSPVAFLHDPIGFVYLLFGVIFSLAGLVCWRKGKSPAPA
jgi:hypothetical protein